MAEERTIKLNVDTKSGQKNVNDLEKAVEGVNKVCIAMSQNMVCPFGYYRIKTIH